MSVSIPVAFFEWEIGMKQFFQLDESREVDADYEDETQCAVTISLTVHNLLRLHDAAIKRAIEEGLDEQATKEDLTDDDGNIDVGACLVMLLDPGTLAGCNIHETNVETWT